MADNPPSDDATLAYRVSVLERQMREFKDDLTARLDRIETALMNLRLHEARMEPFERGVWMIVGVFLTAIAAGVLWATAQAGVK